jgi:hypothetical protein
MVLGGFNQGYPVIDRMLLKSMFLYPEKKNTCAGTWKGYFQMDISAPNKNM